MRCRFLEHLRTYFSAYRPLQSIKPTLNTIAKGDSADQIPAVFLEPLACPSNTEDISAKVLFFGLSSTH